MKILDRSKLKYREGEWYYGVKRLLASNNKLNWGKELKWIPGDMEEDFKLTENSKSKSHYEENQITYKLNNLGWRTEDDLVKSKPGNLFLGCSHTFGQGLYYQDTWAYKVNQHVGGRYYNIGWPGSSLIREFRKLKIALTEYKIQNVFLFLPHYTRYEIYNPYTEHYDVHNPAWVHREMSDRWRRNLSLSENYNFMAGATINAMITLCKQKKVPIFSMSESLLELLQSRDKFSIPNCPCEGKWDFSKGPHDARDNHHPVCIHNFIAQEYINAYDNNIESSFIKMDSYV